jgi:hypothetical protein
MTSEDVATLVDQECGRATFIPLADAIAGFRVKPFVRMLRWQYGSNDEVFPCWVVADLQERKPGLMLAYSEFGHAQRNDHRGIVRAEEECFGRDDSWFLRLEDAFFGAGMWTELLPEHYAVR